MYRLQTGDVSNERWSSQASEDQNCVLSFDAAQRKLLAVFIVDNDVGHLLADFQPRSFQSAGASSVSSTTAGDSARAAVLRVAVAADAVRTWRWLVPEPV